MNGDGPVTALRWKCTFCHLLSLLCHTRLSSLWWVCATPCLKKYAIVFFQIYASFPDLYEICKVNVRSFCMNLYPVWFLVEDLFLMDPIFVWIITLSYFIMSLRIYLYQIIMNRNRLCMNVLWIFSVVFNFFYSLVHVLCQPNVRDARSIFAKQVYMGIQDRRVHGFAVFPQDCLDWKSKTLVICESVCSCWSFIFIFQST